MKVNIFTLGWALLFIATLVEVSLRSVVVMSPSGLDESQNSVAQRAAGNGPGCDSMLLGVAYPRISESDAQLPHKFPEEHDLAYVDVVEPHWTMIFSGSSEDISQKTLEKHISDVASLNIR